ncbi:hypothetical protein KIN20_036784, partial [Parelaphostrongylus tenuis]
RHIETALDLHRHFMSAASAGLPASHHKCFFSVVVRPSMAMAIALLLLQLTLCHAKTYTIQQTYCTFIKSCE